MVPNLYLFVATNRKSYFPTFSATFSAKCREWKIGKTDGHGKSRTGHEKVMEKYCVKSVGTLTSVLCSKFTKTLKPIFHGDATYLVSGVGVGQCPRRQNFVLGIQTCWYLGANATRRKT